MREMEEIRVTNITKDQQIKAKTICISPNSCAKKCFQAHWETLS